MFTLDAFYPDTQIRYQHAPATSGRILGYLPPNRLITPKRFYNNGANIPDAIVEQVDRVAYGGRVILTERLQNFIFHDNFERAYGMSFESAGMWEQAHAINDWVYMLDDDLAYCNFAGSDGRKVPLANLNMTAKWPEMNQITMPSIVELVSDKLTMRGILDEPMYEYYVINAQDPEIEKYNSTAYPDRWHRPVNIIWAHYEGTTLIPEGSEPFGRFRNKIKMPNMVNHTDRAFIRKEWVRILRPGEPLPTPFTKDW